MLLYFKTKTCIQIEHSNIKLIFITYLAADKQTENIYEPAVFDRTHMARPDICDDLRPPYTLCYHGIKTG